MYHWNAKDYSENSTEQEKWTNELLGKVYFKGNERILDIGCGDGKITSQIAKLVPKGSVMGIDNKELKEL